MVMIIVLLIVVMKLFKGKNNVMMEILINMMDAIIVIFNVIMLVLYVTKDFV